MDKKDLLNYPYKKILKTQLLQDKNERETIFKLDNYFETNILIDFTIL